MKKPYEIGYMDGYQDAAEVRNKYIIELLDKIDRLNFELEIANEQLTDNKKIIAEEKELIELGRAVKKIIEA